MSESQNNNQPVDQIDGFDTNNFDANEAGYGQDASVPEFPDTVTSDSPEVEPDGVEANVVDASAEGGAGRDSVSVDAGEVGSSDVGSVDDDGRVPTEPTDGGASDADGGSDDQARGDVSESDRDTARAERAARKAEREAEREAAAAEREAEKEARRNQREVRKLTQGPQRSKPKKGDVDPNDYASATGEQEEGFVRNIVAGGAISRGRGRDYVNGVDHEPSEDEDEGDE